MYWVAIAVGSSNNGGWDVFYPGSQDVIPLIQKHAADMKKLMESRAEGITIESKSSVEVVTKATGAGDECGVEGGVLGYGDVYVGVKSDACVCQQECIDAGLNVCGAWSFCSSTQCGNQYHHCWMKVRNLLQL